MDQDHHFVPTPYCDLHDICVLLNRDPNLARKMLILNLNVTQEHRTTSISSRNKTISIVPVGLASILA